ncbi:hypothetical protein [Luteolibacter sp. LG18]|uniref:hypothetical protein n=1 Tax=Luteolibacter sp. LG18 TaxID=2819286 RepID=UPI002B29EF52|nr:hypothetical protein llg_10250 [Luteolibacter sp. LG18]
MKLLVMFALMWAACLSPIRAEAPPAAVRAYLIQESGDFQEVWLTAVADRVLHYRETELAGPVAEMDAAKVKSVYFFKPQSLREALALYRGRKYKEARERFAAVRATYQAIHDLAENPASIAGFYELECLRQMDDPEALAKALETFRSSGLVRDCQLRQLEILVFWDALRTKSWEKLDAMAVERADEELPGYQRAQIAFCHGVALENLGKPTEALDAYNTAITADGGASETIARQAALNVLRIHKADPDVQTAIRRWGSADEARDVAGRQHLLEAAAVARLYEDTLGAGQPLPGPFKEFLKYGAPVAP